MPETGATYSGRTSPDSRNPGVVPRRRGSECLSTEAKNFFFQIKNGLGTRRGAATSKFFLSRALSCALPRRCCAPSQHSYEEIAIEGTENAEIVSAHSLGVLGALGG